GSNSQEDDLCFATAERLSEVNHGLYETFVAPVVRAMVTESTAEVMRRMHPNRVRFAIFSDQNPAMRSVERLASVARERQQPAAPGNPFLVMEKVMSSWINECLTSYGSVRDTVTEQMFLTIYGSPYIQALMGLGKGLPQHVRHIERELIREAEKARLR